MMNNYIVFQNYRGFKNHENILMSLIVGLHNSKKTICFSNGYAAFRCGVSKSTITRTISKFVEEGYISCYFKPEGRVIHFLKLPILVDYEESCDTTPHSQDDYTPNHDDYTPSSQGLTPLITTTTNNIDNNIDNNIEYNIADNIAKTINPLNDYKKKYEDLVSQFILEGFSNEEAKQYAKDALVFL